MGLKNKKIAHWRWKLLMGSFIIVLTPPCSAKLDDWKEIVLEAHQLARMWWHMTLSLMVPSADLRINAGQAPTGWKGYPWSTKGVLLPTLVCAWICGAVSQSADHLFWIRCWKPGFGGVQMLSYIHPQALGNCGCAYKVTKSESDPWNPPSLDEGAKEGQ